WESGFNDGLTCKRCLHAGYEWQSEIASNRFVVLFENDLEREDRTMPGGLSLYGELAALSAGRPRNFLEFYEVMKNYNREPPDVGAFYDGTRTEFASYLYGRLDAARPSTVIWHFERPTQWERWVIGRLDWTFDSSLPAGSAVEPLDGGGARLHLLLGAVGQSVAFDVPSQVKLGPTSAFAGRIGLDCAVRVGAHWWAVDPTTGDLRTTDPGGTWLPKGSWTGAGTDGHGRLVLASADQWLGVYDLEQRIEVERFAAEVSPSLRVSTGECAPVLVGDGWYGTFNNLTSVLTVYDAEGNELGARDLNRFLGLGSNRITAIAAQGRHVAVGTSSDEVVMPV